jgi:NAD-dependent deacetylase
VLVVGSSLEVYPVAGLADLAERLAIVNMGQTPYHERAELTIDAPAGETLTEVVRHLP